MTKADIPWPLGGTLRGGKTEADTVKLRARSFQRKFVR
jgi:hypothetical protein